MSTEILVNAMSYETRVAIVDHGLAQEIHIERPRRRGLVGNIYQGRVVRVLPGMQAAFVDIGDERTAFLHAADIERMPYLDDNADSTSLPEIQTLLREGESVLVQVLKDPLGAKGARVTTRISIPSRYMVYVPGGREIGVSTRIEDPHERERLQHLVGLLRPPDIEGGYIVRTAGEGARTEALRADMLYLSRLWSSLAATAGAVSPGTLIHEDLPLVLRVMRDLLDEDVSQLRVDCQETGERMRSFAEMFLPDFAGRIAVYTGDSPIFDHYGIEDEIVRALERRVELKSGGYLMFDQTEAMTTIDVNTGAFTGSRSLNETAFKTNLEAAQAVARQLRLRNLGGLIIIDFIDMEEAGHRELVIETLKRELAMDRARTSVSAVSALGLVEMTRKRTRESLEHVLTESCKYCDGRGTVKTTESVCFDIYREVARIAGHFAAPRYLVLASGEVIGLLLDEESANLAGLSVQIGRPIGLQVEDRYLPEQFDVIPL